MKNVMGVIYTGDKDGFLRELTMLRSIAAVPVAGRYRVIDFLMSGMVNSGIKNVGVILQKNYSSLMDHVGSGKEWDLHGKNDGLYLLPPYLTRENVGVYGGTLDALRSNMNYLRRSRQEYVLFCNSIILYNPRFNDMFESYLKTGCDVMMLYTRDPGMIRSEYGTYLEIGEDQRVTDMEIDPTNPRFACTSMNAMIMRKDLLIDLVDRGSAHGYHDLHKDVLQRLARDAGLSVYGYEYKDPCYRLDSVQAYFNMNLQLLQPEDRHAFFKEDRPVYTKVRDEMAARYLEHAQVLGSLVADGSIIDGTVENSVLFRGVKVAKGAKIKNCIIMQDSRIEEGAELENCILDKQAIIHANTRLIGPATYPIVISKNMTI